MLLSKKEKDWGEVVEEARKRRRGWRVEGGVYFFLLVGASVGHTFLSEQEKKLGASEATI